MDKHMDDFCEGKTLRETPVEVLNARRKRNQEIEANAEKCGRQLPAWDPHLLITGEDDETEHWPFPSDKKRGPSKTGRAT